MNPLKRSALILVLLSFVAASLAAPEENPAIDPKAAQVLKEMSDYLGDLKQFAFRTRNFIDLVLKGGQKITLISSSRSLVRRPDRVMSERSGEPGRLRLFYDGHSATLFDLKGHHYAQRAIEGDLHKVLDYLRDNLGIEVPAADLMYPDSYEGLMETAEAATYVGTVELDGILCHHLAFRAEEVDWQLWVEVGERPLPRRYSLISKWTTGAPEFAVTFQEWEFPKNLPDSMFQFKAPQGAKKIEFEDGGK